VGELLANQCRVGLARTERLVKERMTLFDQGVESMSPQKLNQSEGALGSHPGLLWPQPAIAVHGPDQPAGRIDAQTPPLRPWAGRPFA